MKEIPLTRGLFAIVDDDDYPLLVRHRWHAGVERTGRPAYAKRQFLIGAKSVFLKMEHFILGSPTDNAGVPVTIDHKNGNTLDNRKENLRWASDAENSWNTRQPQSKFGRGVTTVPSPPNAKPFVVRISCLGKRVFVGNFSNAQQARDAYDSAALRLHGEFAVLNRDHWKGGS